MQQTIYCDCFYCEHYEDGKCLSPVLHLGHYDRCNEFAPSEEKLNAYLAAHGFPAEEKEEGSYGTPNLKPIAIHIRQKNNP